MEITEQMADEMRAFLKENAKAIHLHNEHLSCPEDLYDILPYERNKITYLQSNIISDLAHAEAGYLSMGELAKKEGLSKGAITQAISALVKLGIVRRFQKEDNLRNAYAELTDYGKSMRKQEIQLLEEYFTKKLYAVLSFDDVLKLKEAMICFSSMLKRLEKAAE